MTTYSVFFPIVPGISDKYKGCDPRHFIGYCFEDDNKDQEFTIKYTNYKTYDGIMVTSPNRDYIWSIQDLTDHGHGVLSEEDIQDFISDDDWTEEDQDYYDYRLILERLNEGLN